MFQNEIISGSRWLTEHDNQMFNGLLLSKWFLHSAAQHKLKFENMSRKQQGQSNPNTNTNTGHFIVQLMMIHDGDDNGDYK